MTTIRDAIDEYLTLRRALGFKLAKHDRLLNDFVDDLEHTGASTITIAAAVAWATKPAAAQPVQCRCRRPAAQTSPRARPLDRDHDRTAAGGR